MHVRSRPIADIHLSRHRQDMPADSSHEVIRPYPLITEAIRMGNWPETAHLLNRYPEMRTLNVPAFGSWLHYACARGTREIVAGLVSQGFEASSKSERDEITPLAFAASSGKAEIVDLLLGLGVPLDTSTSEGNPLFRAVLARSEEVARALLDAGIDTTPRYKLGSIGETVDAVAFAMLHGARDLARLIALRDGSGDEDNARSAMDQGLRIAHAITSK
ncbi:ankyrin repeat domain-containing protein [Brevundimonas sp.]|uniref:ankyrin repeat domain-containing protein n=1 Tax=Brevundimonas sp. TaxID=1871086 RepID=UPI0025C0E8E3|nr:ankyrin repeat domain-containing protein [Brevundimonas sp.]